MDFNTIFLKIQLRLVPKKLSEKSNKKWTIGWRLNFTKKQAPRQQQRWFGCHLGPYSATWWVHPTHLEPQKLLSISFLLIHFPILIQFPSFPQYTTTHTLIPLHIHLVPISNSFNLLSSVFFSISNNNSDQNDAVSEASKNRNSELHTHIFSSSIPFSSSFSSSLFRVRETIIITLIATRINLYPLRWSN